MTATSRNGPRPPPLRACVGFYRAIAEAVVALVRRCWESGGGGGEGGGGEVVPAAAGRLLMALTTVLPSSALETSPAVAGLLKDASQVCMVWRGIIWYAVCCVL